MAEDKRSDGFLDDLLKEIRYFGYCEWTNAQESLNTVRALAVRVGISISRLLISISLSSETFSLSRWLASRSQEPDCPEITHKILRLFDKVNTKLDLIKTESVARAKPNQHVEELLDQAIEDVELCVPFLVDRSCLMELETGLALADMESCVQNLQRAKALSKALKDMSESEMVETYCKNLDRQLVHMWESMFINRGEKTQKKGKRSNM